MLVVGCPRSLLLVCWFVGCWLVVVGRCCCYCCGSRWFLVVCGMCVGRCCSCGYCFSFVCLNSLLVIIILFFAFIIVIVLLFLLMFFFFFFLALRVVS